jgi:hypothetical protein
MCNPVFCSPPETSILSEIGMTANRAPASSERAYFHEPPNLPNEAVFRPLGPLLRADVTAALIPALK